MVSKLDDCVGDIMTALNEKNMLGNTIVLFMTDNGAPTLGVHANTGSNNPFRGVSLYTIDSEQMRSRTEICS